jgi:hypothetical protein
MYSLQVCFVSLSVVTQIKCVCRCLQPFWFFHTELYFSPYQIVTEYRHSVNRLQYVFIYFPSRIYGRKLCKMFILFSLLAVGIQDSSVSIVTILQVSRLALGPTQPSLQWELGVKQPGNEDNQSFSSAAKTKNAWSYTLPPPPHMPLRHAHSELEATVCNCINISGNATLHELAGCLGASWVGLWCFSTEIK